MIFCIPKNQHLNYEDKIPPESAVYPTPTQKFEKIAPQTINREQYHRHSRSRSRLKAKYQNIKKSQK
jgi:hypothetical protein